MKPSSESSGSRDETGEYKRTSVPRNNRGEPLMTRSKFLVLGNPLIQWLCFILHKSTEMRLFSQKPWKNSSSSLKFPTLLKITGPYILDIVETVAKFVALDWIHSRLFRLFSVRPNLVRIATFSLATAFKGSWASLQNNKIRSNIYSL